MFPNANENEDFNPFVILNIDDDASVSEIKRAYHELAKQHHPDRGRDPEKFKTIARTYETLTNERAREN